MTFKPRQTIVVPVDFETPVQVVDAAAEFAADSSSLHIIHVLAPVASYDPVAVWGTLPDAKRVSAVQEELKKQFGRGHEGATFVASVGDAARGVASYAEEVEAELVVIMSHQRRGIPRVMLGSVAERVTRFAPCPVLVLRAKHFVPAADGEPAAGQP